MAFSSLLAYRACRKVVAATSVNLFGVFSGIRVSAAAAKNMCTLSESVSAIPYHEPVLDLPSRTSQWLMLSSPLINKVYNFYSLAENKILTFDIRSPSSCDLDFSKLEFKGSSHGWLVLYKRKNHDLFLLNPISGRHLKLPSIRTLGLTENQLGHGNVSVDFVILSSSPDEKDCRAVILYGPEGRLAFCCPGDSTNNTKWTKMISTNLSMYNSCVYSSTHKLFFSVTTQLKFEAWNLLVDPSSSSSPNFFVPMEPPNILSALPVYFGDSYRQHNFLVMVPPVGSSNSDGDVLLVRRIAFQGIAPDGSNAAINNPDGYSYDADDMMYPYKTVRFEVYKIIVCSGDGIGKTTKLKYMKDCLDGLAIFIGYNHSFALKASDFPELKPNSIYYTDTHAFDIMAFDKHECEFGGHDIGIYNYEDKTISPCYYPCDVQSITRIDPPPMWFTPSCPPPPLS